MNIANVIYEEGSYFVLKIKGGYEVYKNSITHSIRCAQIGNFSDGSGLKRAKDEIKRRITKDENN